jgi:hypothetical protein
MTWRSGGVRGEELWVEKVGFVCVWGGNMGVMGGWCWQDGDTTALVLSELCISVRAMCRYDLEVWRRPG